MSLRRIFIHLMKDFARFNFEVRLMNQGGIRTSLLLFTDMQHEIKHGKMGVKFSLKKSLPHHAFLLRVTEVMDHQYNENEHVPSIGER